MIKFYLRKKYRISLDKKALIKAEAIKTIEIEAHALQLLSKTIDDNFVNVVSLIAGSTGRLVITGIGKSALVGKKMVATLNSTGTPSLFMHAADAIHGDLGMITEHDILLCISKSGDTAELKILVPLVKSMGCPVIVMSSNPDSFSARTSNYFLFVPVDEEADPNNLAPTASTTAQMALGDAIAVALLSLKGFTPRNFAKYHPGGSLGKQLYLRVSDLSSRNEKPFVRKGDSLKKVIIEISSKRLGSAAVLDEHDKICGIVTDGDIRRMLSKIDDLSNITAQDIMSSNPKCIEPDELAVNALQKMRSHNINQLLVSSNKELTGVIHIHDLIDEGFI
jgi:arabinose-5-phosphate isomerase